MVVLALLATGAIVAAYLTGDDFLEHKPELRTSPQVQTHEDRAGRLLWVTIAFGVIALVSGWFATRTGRAPGRARRAAGRLRRSRVLVLVVLTGDAGARAVWG